MGGIAVFGRLLKFYFLSPLILILAIALFVHINKMQSLYQRKVIRKVKKIKERKNAYINEKQDSKLPRLERKHEKAVKSLKKTIKRIMFFNTNIIFSNSKLKDETNLALPHQEAFTFNSLSKSMVDEFNAKHKRRIITINASKKKNNKAISSKNTVVVEEDLLEVKESVKTNQNTQVNKSTEEKQTTKPNNQKPSVRNLTEEESILLDKTSKPVLPEKTVQKPTTSEKVKVDIYNDDIYNF